MINREDFQKFYSETLLPVLKELEDVRMRALRTFRKYLTLGVGGTLVFLLIMYLAFGIINLLTLIPVGIAIIATISYYVNRKKDWTSLFKQRVIHELVKFVNSDFTYESQNGISKEEFYMSGLFKQDIDKYSSEDLIYGKVGETDLRCSEVHAIEIRESTDSKGNRTRTEHTIFRGVFVIADFHKEFHGQTVVLPDVEQALFGRLGQFFQGLASKFGMTQGQLVKLEDPEFENLFKVYSSDQIEARYILSPSMMQRIVEFRKKQTHHVFISFFNSDMYIGVWCNRNRFEPPSLFIKPDKILKPETLREYLEDIQFIADIVEQMNLNTRIWSK